MKYSIRHQFSLIFIGLLAGALALCLFLNNTFLEDYYIQTKTRTINDAYEIISSAFSGGEIDEDILDEFFETSFQDNIITVAIDESGQLAFASFNGGDEFLEAVRLYRMGWYTFEEDTVTSFYNMMDRTEYLGRFGSLEGDITYLICMPLKSIQDSVAIANRFLAYAGILVAVLGGVVIWWVTKKITDPIQDLAAISEKMTNLDFDAKYNGKSHTEIALLGENINKLSDSLEHTISELKTANNELMRDIEKKEKLDQMRQEFISNVSHELKTPIALIQGYAEGLAEGINDDPESMQFYCEVIMDEAGKMNNMVQKLLTLNQLEFGNDTVSMERFDIVTLVKNYIQSAQILTNQQEIEVRFTETKPIYVWGDEFKVEEVFMNYFSNAMNHCKDMRGLLADNTHDGSSSPSGKIIDVKIYQANGKVRVTVFNTGEPVPEESLPHLWEKFYKVDKARTREYGGSGVGLSIVQAIMESMNQAYGVDAYDNGMLFWFELEAVQEVAVQNS